MPFQVGTPGTTLNVECANKGICDRDTGLCECFDACVGRSIGRLYQRDARHLDARGRGGFAAAVVLVLCTELATQTETQTHVGRARLLPLTPVLSSWALRCLPVAVVLRCLCVC